MTLSVNNSTAACIGCRAQKQKQKKHSFFLNLTKKTHALLFYCAFHILRHSWGTNYTSNYLLFKYLVRNNVWPIVVLQTSPRHWRLTGNIFLFPRDWEFFHSRRTLPCFFFFYLPLQTSGSSPHTRQSLWQHNGAISGGNEGSGLTGWGYFHKVVCHCRNPGVIFSCLLCGRQDFRSCWIEKSRRWKFTASEWSWLLQHRRHPAHRHPGPNSASRLLQLLMTSLSHLDTTYPLKLTHQNSSLSFRGRKKNNLLFSCLEYFALTPTSAELYNEA